MRLLPDGRYVELKSELSFVDAQETRWSVPEGAVVDGASIPMPFWSIVGSPLTGRYRDAAIIHDWYCDVRTRSWQATHRVFFDAMIASAVEPILAKIMYFAVRWGGPRWEPRVSHNTTLGAGEKYQFEGAEVSPESVRQRTVEVASPSQAVTPEDQVRVAEAAISFIGAEEPSLREIEQLAERRSFPL